MSFINDFQVVSGKEVDESVILEYYQIYSPNGKDFLSGMNAG